MPHAPWRSKRDSQLKEPRTGKSFRAAAERIVREESAVPSTLTNLLDPPMPPATPRRDEWAIRLAALATLGQYDGLAIVVGDPLSVVRAHNVAGDPSADAAIRGAIEDVGRRAAMAQVRASVPLADGRTADALLVAPLGEATEMKGALIGMRVGRSFARGDALTAWGIAELLTLEVRRLLTSRREEAVRREALTLYELARLALFGEELDESLQNAITLLADTLDHQVAHLWMLRSGGSLELRAAYPAGGQPLGILRPRDLDVLSDALYEGRVVRVANRPPYSWVPGATQALLVAPVTDGPRPLGLLVLGRTHEPYLQADEDLARVVGTFLARLIAVRGQAESRPDSQTSRSAEVEDWENEREPTAT